MTAPAFASKYAMSVCAIAVAILITGSLSSQAEAANYGAIAYAPHGGAIGYTWNYGSQGSAQSHALGHCRHNGGRDCKIVIWFRDACGAIAVNRAGAYGAGWGSTQGIANAYAVRTCSKYGGGCYVRKWICTSR